MTTRISQDKIDLIIELNKKGFTNTEISKDVEVTEASVRRQLDLNNLTRNLCKQELKKLNQTQKDLIKDLYLSGLSVSKVSEKMNVGENQIYRLLKGLARNPSEARRIFPVEEKFFSSVVNEAQAYWLGFIYADGCVYRNALSISLSQKDEAHLESFKNLLSPSRSLQTYISKYSPTPLVRLEVKSQIMVDDLYKLGVVSDKTFKLDSLPDIPNSLMHHFIRGYFDGDGSVSIAKCKRCPSHQSLRFNLIGTFNFLTSIKNYLVSECCITNTKLTKCRANCESYSYTKGGNIQVKSLYNFLYNNSTIYLERKRSKFESVFFKEAPSLEIS